MLQLIQIPVLHDNTVWMLVKDTPHGRDALVVDPPEIEPVLGALAREGATLRTILSTHHHADHVGANAELVRRTGASVVGNGADRSRIPALFEATAPGEFVSALGLTFRVLDVAAHTRAHIAYALDAPVDVVIRHGHEGVARAIERLAHRPVLFVGDSLFHAGCGRLFEGTPDDLVRVMRTLAAEDPRALVCCAHEYTASNLAFAVSVVDDERVRARLASLDDEKGATGSSLPDTLARELETNPFLLVLDDARRATLAQRLGVNDDVVTVMGAMRAAKDTF
jgi:hydroxyacylglutathione hydrolase